MTISRAVAVAPHHGARKAPDLPLEIGEDAVAPLGAQGVEGAFEVRFVVEHPLLPPRRSFLVPNRPAFQCQLAALHHLVATAKDRRFAPFAAAPPLTVNP